MSRGISASAGKHARSLTYKHNGDRYEVVVGQPRKRYPRKTGPRGGYIKNADWQAWGNETGSTVTDIVDTGHVIEVWSEEPSRGWVNPSLVGHDEVISIKWADPPGEPYRLGCAHREDFAHQHGLYGGRWKPETGYTGPMYRGPDDHRVFGDEENEAAFQRAYRLEHGQTHEDPCKADAGPAHGHGSTGYT